MAFSTLQRTASFAHTSAPTASMIRQYVFDSSFPKEADSFSPLAVVDSLALELKLSSNDGVSNIDRIYIAKKTVGAGGLTLTLTGDTNFIDPFGDQIDFTGVFYIMIDNAGTPSSPNTGVLAQDTTVTDGFAQLGGAVVNRGSRYEMIRREASSGADVDATHKVIALTRTGAVDEEITILIVGTTT